MQDVVGFEELRREDVARAGGKGSNLGELVRAGLPVPAGFVVVTQAYEAHLAAAGLGARIASGLACDAASLEAACDEVQRWIVEAPLAPALGEAIGAAYAALAVGAGAATREPAVAVRSSATTEDLGDASFAGQQETYLNVRGATQLLARLRACWASLWSARAVGYRARSGRDPLAASIAVVVQVMVPAEVAGVMFTADPVTGDRTRIAIDASWGLGESVVSGVVTPDHFVLGPRGRIVARTLGAKATRVVPAQDGTRTEPTPSRERARYCLARDQLRELAALGRRVEAHYGGAPQDIEWALAAGRMYLLQARPITALADAAAPPARAPGQMVDALIDHLPEPLTPLDYAVVRASYDAIAALGALAGFRAPGADTVFRERGDGMMLYAVGSMALTPAVLWRVPALARKAFATDTTEAWAPIRVSIAARLEALAREAPGALDAPTLAARVHEAIAVLDQHVPPRFATIPSMAAAAARLRLYARWAVGRRRIDAVDRALYLALPYRTGLMNQAVARLARLAALEGREGPAFAAELERLLGEWGDRPVRGMAPTIASPTWREDPSMALGLVDALLGASRVPDPDASHRAQQAALAAAVAEVEAGLRARLRPGFRRALARARGALVAREDGLFMFERATATARRFALALGEQLAQRGVLATRDDVFMLRRHELGPVASGALDPRAAVARRRRQYDRLLDAHARGEHWLYASGSVARPPSPRASKRGEHVLRGVAASGGRATGVVRVVRTPHEFGRVQRGDVLVASFTAPAWTPLFALVSAVVTDVGGAGSHAAIVAREYGIPAVLGTATATQRLRDGERVVVDGTEGWVALERAT